MAMRSDSPFPLLSTILQFLAIPCNFVAGFVTGLVAPVAAIAAMVAGVQLLTGKVPFLNPIQEDEEGGRHLSLALIPQDQVGDLFAQHKEQIGDDLGQLQAEIRTIIQESKAEGQASAQEDSEEVPAEA